MLTRKKVAMVLTLGLQNDSELKQITLLPNSVKRFTSSYLFQM